MELIKATGRVNSPLMLVSDYPTEVEYHNKVAISGSAFDFWFNLFKSAKLPISIAETWRTSFYKVPVPGAKSKLKKDQLAALASVESIADWTSIISNEIKQVNPNIIVAIGELAMNNLTGRTKIGLRAGSWYPLLPKFGAEKPIRVLPVLSHRDVYNDWTQYTLVKNDLQRIKLFLNKATPITPDYKTHVCEKSAHFIQAINQFARPELCVFDVETHHNFITCIGFSFDGVNSVSVPLLLKSWTPEELGRTWLAIRRLLSSKIPKVNQNIKYDWNRLDFMNFPVNNIIGDTMLRAAILYPEFPKGLAFLTRMYTDIGYYKDEGKEYDPAIHGLDRLLEYNGKDTIATFRVFKEQQKELADWKLNSVNDNLQRSFFVYRKLDANGILIDTLAQSALVKKYNTLVEVMEGSFSAVTCKPFNINSTACVADLIYNTLGAEKRIQAYDENTGKTTYKTAKLELEDIELHFRTNDKPFAANVVRDIIITKRFQKSAQFASAIVHPDGRIRTSYKLQGTETGRTATGKPLESILILENGVETWAQPGLSFQQIPKHPYYLGDVAYGKDLRKMFIARPGWSLVEFDLSQAEARVVDVLAEDYESLAEYGTIDKHKKVACMIYDVPFDQIDTITKDQRQDGKRGKHAANYDETPFNLARRTHDTIAHATTILDKIHASNPRIRSIFHSTIRNNLKSNRILGTPFGRRREFYGRETEKMYKEGYAYIPQSTIPDHMKFNVMNPLYDLIDDSWCLMLVEWHDSLVSEVRDDKLSFYCDTIRRLASTPITFRTGTFIRDYELVIPIDLAVGKNWYEMEPVR